MSEQTDINQAISGTQYAATSATGSAAITIINYNYPKNTNVVPVESTDAVDDNLSCPYRGLFHFGPDDAPYFCGRDVFIEELFAATQTRNFIPVLGASGSGKSSVVLAGLVPRLQKEGHWLFTHFRPGSDPFSAMAEALVPLYRRDSDTTDEIVQTNKLAKHFHNGDISLSNVISKIQRNYPNHKVLLIADQFEELYVSCQNNEKQHSFLEQVLQVINNNAQFYFVLTLRADFFGNALSYRPFADALQDADVKLGPMDREELKEAIEKPAKSRGVNLQDGLSERIIEDVEGKTGNLPLLQFALKQLWEKRDGMELTHKAYKEIDGVENALANYANNVYQGLDKEEQQRAQQIFIQLVYPGEGTEHTRRLATRAEVGEDNWAVVTKVADKRLVVTGSREEEKKSSVSSQHPNSDSIEREETVELIHEALIHKWQLLQVWIQSDRDFRTWQERLRASMRQWRISNEDKGALLRGFPLNEAENWLEKRRNYLSPDEQKYIEISLKVKQQEEDKRKEEEFEKRILTEANETLEQANQKAKRKIKIGTIIFGISVFFAAIASTYGVIALKEAQEGTKLEQAGVNALRQMPSSEIDALLSAIQVGQDLKKLIKDGRPVKDYPATSPILALQKILATIRQQNQFDTGQKGITSVRFSPDGQYIGTAGKDGTVRILSLSGEEKLALEGHKGKYGEGQANSVSFSPDSKTIATAGEDGTVKLWNLSGKLLLTLQEKEGGIKSVRFSRDGSKIATAGYYGIARIWDLSGKQLATFKGHDGAIGDINFSPDGKTIATAANDGTVRLWDYSGKQLAQFLVNKGGKLASVSFSPNGQYLATAGYDNTALIWNLSTRQATQLKGHKLLVHFVSFSPDGKRLVTASDDGTAKLWNLSGEQIYNFQGHRGVVLSGGFSEDNKYLATAGYDGILRVWNLYDKQKVEFKGHQNDVNTLSWSKDGKLIVTADHDGNAILWNLSGEKIKQWQGDSRGPLWGISFSPNSKLIAAGGYDNVGKIWDLSGKLITRLEGHKHFILDISFSPDGKYIATAGADSTARIWDISGKPIAILKGHKNVVDTTSFSPDGNKIVTGGQDGNIIFWDLSGQQLKQWQAHQNKVRGLSFSPNGQQLATADNNSVVKLWDLSGRKQLEFFSYQSGVNGLSFSPDGQYLATKGMDGTVRLWDLKGRQVAEFNIKKGSVWSLSFSPDGSSIIAGGDNGSLQLWEVKQLNELLSQGCQWLQDYRKSHVEKTKNLQVCK